MDRMIYRQGNRLFDHPNPGNFCGNGFPDWLEVNLTPHCNANCAWCVERDGWHPRNVATWKEIADAAILTGRTNIILLGGEPTLHQDFSKIVARIADAGFRPWVTTNGSNLMPEWVRANMYGIFGVNVSIHHFDMVKNMEITGLFLREGRLRRGIAVLRKFGAIVRMNCNSIQGYVDSVEAIRSYIGWAKSIGAMKVRFAELKHADGKWVDLAAVLGHKYGLNDNPFTDGCNSDAVIDGMPVRFRQMCGMQTRRRPCPKHPEIKPHPVLYYDGNLYDGWQQKKESDMTTRELIQLLEMVKEGKMSVSEAAVMIDRHQRNEQEHVLRAEPEGGGSCVY